MPPQTRWSPPKGCLACYCRDEWARWAVSPEHIASITHGADMMENFSLQARDRDGMIQKFEFEDCREVVEWLVGTGETPVVEVEMAFVSDWGERIIVTIPF